MSWYDEAPDDLTRCVLSMRDLVDAAVFVDGAYTDFPNGTPCSADEQMAAIAAACAESGLEHVIHRPGTLGCWRGVRGNEVPKRNATLALCGAMRADWVQIVDADWEFVGDAARVRAALAGTDMLVASAWCEHRAHRFTYRWHPTLRYHRTHYCVLRGDDTLWCPAGSKQLEDGGVTEQIDALDLADCLIFEHHDREDFWRVSAQEAFYALRNDHGLESMDRGEITLNAHRVDDNTPAPT